MSTVQTTYGNVSENVKTTRPRVESDTFTEGGAFTITFEDDQRAKHVAMELAQLLGCSPDDFGYGEKEGKPLPISIEEMIIECAIAIAHLRLRYPLPPQPAKRTVPAATLDEEETISLPDGKNSHAQTCGSHARS